MKFSRYFVFALIALLSACAPIAPVPPRPQQAATAPAERVPLADALTSLEPQAVWQNFYDLTQIPRPSGHEEHVREFMVAFGSALGLETIVDGVGNVVIRRPAAPGLEGRKGVVLQAHMDMVPVKATASDHNFLTDPIEAVVDGEWVRANGTTLGADNGIGMALAMAVLQSHAPTGPLEALFTVDEESQMTGANGLEPGLLQGDFLINLDNEVEGEFVIGSAGGMHAEIASEYAKVATPAGLQGYQVTIGGLRGGHSGMDIDQGRGHAIHLLVRLLRDASATWAPHLASIAGGSAPNALPSEASALVGISTEEAAAFVAYVESFETIVRQELGAVEPDLYVTVTPAELPATVMAKAEERALIHALNGSPQGVIRKSDAVPGLVETSLNLGILHVEEGQIDAVWYLRSAVDTALDDLAGRLASVWQLADMNVAFSARYSGWEPDPASPLLHLMQQTYKELYGKDPGVGAVHAGLECGTIRALYPGLDAISVGPTMLDVHSPSEQLEIASVAKVLALITETLNRTPQ